MDGKILLLIQEYLRHPVLDPIALAITSLNDHAFLSLAVCAVLLMIRRTRKVGAVATASLALNVLVVNVAMKPLVARMRPYEAIEELLLLGKAQSDFSFPSGHSAAAFAVAVVMLRLLPRKYGVPAVAMAALIALSRLYVGVHYPTDVLAGVVIGTATALVCSCASRKRMPDKI